MITASTDQIIWLQLRPARDAVGQWISTCNTTAGDGSCSSEQWPGRQRRGCCCARGVTRLARAGYVLHSLGTCSWIDRSHVSRAPPLLCSGLWTLVLGSDGEDEEEKDAAAGSGERITLQCNHMLWRRGPSVRLEGRLRRKRLDRMQQPMYQ